jgi:hypothetical protein
MRLVTPEEMPADLRGVVCRQSRVVSALGTAVLLALIIGVPAFLMWQAELPWWVMVFAAALAGFVVRWFLGNMVKSWRPSNWLLRIDRDGLWINIRSYLNRDFAPAKTVIHVPYNEIARVREHIVKRAEKTSDSTTVWTDRYMDLELLEAAPEEIRAELAEERRRHVTRSHLGGFVTSRSRNGHVPVTAPENDVIRIAWRGRYDWVSPSLRRALQELRPRVRIGEPTRDDRTDLHALSAGEVDKLTRELVESGDKLGAIKLLTDRRGCSTTEARQLVEELTGAV